MRLKEFIADLSLHENVRQAKEIVRMYIVGNIRFEIVYIQNDKFQLSISEIYRRFERFRIALVPLIVILETIRLTENMIRDADPLEAIERVVFEALRLKQEHYQS